MNKAVTDLKAESEIVTDPLVLLRRPFEARHISKLPKPSKKQTDEVKANFKAGIRCKECGAWHHPDVVHLDYVGHAALTDRLLDADIMWTWEPCAFGQDGLPAFDSAGGLWIRLTVGGVTRLGYGNADAKPNQDAGARQKEVIGDALRNAAMRFGAALDLWHKGDLHAETNEDPTVHTFAEAEELAMNLLRGCGSKELFADAWGKNKDGWKRALPADSYARIVGEMKRLAGAFSTAPPPRQPDPPPAEDFTLSDDEIPF